MTDAHPPSRYALLVISGRSTPGIYSLQEAADIVAMHPERLRYYCRRGIFGAAMAHPEGEPVFDDDRLYELRRFEHFRKAHGVNPPTLRLLCELWREVERLQAELRYFRGR